MSAGESAPADARATPSFEQHELIPAVVQDAGTGRVLMLGYMNRESFERTLSEGEVWFWSRSRGRLWRKGETSGNVLRVRAVRIDCDGDAILVLADPAGPTCHTGAVSCFFTTAHGSEGSRPATETAAELFAVVRRRVAERPEGSYVAKLAAGGVDRMAKKVGEEATEVVIAALKGDRAELTREMADLWFHSYVLLAQAGLRPEDVWAELARRRR
jgi:phosphoribosyl-ATP pyrophosphohydrolase/phosphoribosyl-AMP cyclohydrolase